MFGQPETVPEHKAVEQFWNGLTRFILFTAVLTGVSAFATHIERRAHEALN
jgi:hypothetical protein